MPKCAAVILVKLGIIVFKMYSLKVWEIELVNREMSSTTADILSFFQIFPHAPTSPSAPGLQKNLLGMLSLHFLCLFWDLHFPRFFWNYRSCNSSKNTFSPGGRQILSWFPITCLLIFMPECNSLPLTVGGNIDFLLIERLWWSQCGIAPLVMLPFIRLYLSRLQRDPLSLVLRQDVMAWTV